MNILSLQPFFGGSHASFIEGWIRHSRHDWTQLNLPARFWKWRMRHAAVEFAQRIDELWSRGQRFDLLVTTDMLNVAEFRGLLKSPARDVRVLVYFHENQLVYPNQTDEPRDFHFSFTNLTSTLAADAVWFNSAFNRDSMVAELFRVAKKWPDYRPTAAIERIRAVAQIQPPGIEVPDNLWDRALAPDTSLPLHLVWAARWEHDKDPDSLFRILKGLQASGTDFRVSVIGESFARVPDAFGQIEESFSKQIVRFGFQESRDEYWDALLEADLILSTARHEFFGLSVVEGLAAGLVPLLPNRLAYPGLIDRLELPQACLYDSEGGAIEQLKRLANSLESLRDRKLRRESASRVVEKFGWAQRAAEMDGRLDRLVTIGPIDSEGDECPT